MEADKTVGAITWMDLTIVDAEGVRDFYKQVVGWETTDISMGEYNDYCMSSPEDQKVRSGICHHRGSNQGIPPMWIMYINVADLNVSIEAVKNGGGEVVHGPRRMGDKARFCIIRDPAGAFAGLYDHGDR